MKLKNAMQRINLKLGATVVATLVDNSGLLGFTVYDVATKNKQGPHIERFVVDENREVGGRPGVIIARLRKRTVEELNELLKFDLSRFKPAHKLSKP